MKKILTVLLCAVLAIFFAGCGTYVAPTKKPGGSTGDPSQPGGTVTPGGDTGIKFSVTLQYNYNKFVPQTPMQAQWKGTDGSIFRSDFVDGVATAYGLDGEYNVTLVSLPQGYTYNPNIYFADNDHSEILINLVQVQTLNTLTGPLSQPNAARAPSVAVGNTYRLVFNSPTDHGIFSVVRGTLETWCDTTANDINVLMNGSYFVQGSGYLNTSINVLIAGGGASSTYTKNIKADFGSEEYEDVNIVDMTVTSRSNTYPITVDFVFNRSTAEGGGTGPQEGTYTSRDVEDRSLLKTVQPMGTFRYVWRYTTNHVLHGEYYKLFERGTVDAAGNEGDGYYHYYDAATDTYGYTLFAVINHNSEILPTEGSDDTGTGGFMYTLVNKKLGDYDYTAMISTYASYCNSDGAHPLTEELKQFMYEYALREHYFDDGNGWAELMGLNSNETDQWLFHCGYYA